jgi:4'-phosphopantetheinyl transferase
MTTASAVDVWYLRTDAHTPAQLIDRALALLSAAERERYERFVFDKNKHEYLATRWLVRNVLANYTGRKPIDLAFTPNKYGRPLLDDGGDLRFNLTNTLSLIACSVRRDAREAGIDAEPLSRGKEVISIASTVFMDREQKSLFSLPSGAPQERRAIELWTLTEAYMKARGMGMSIPPDRFEVTLDGELVFHDPVVDDPTRWCLKTLEIEGHLVSLCIERPEKDVAVHTLTA